MKKGLFLVRENRRLANDIYLLRLEGDASGFTAPGQFADIELPGFFLRRPFSVCCWDDGGFSLVYRVAGGGTERMSGLPLGTELDVLTGLGNGFDVALCGKAPLLVGGGSGVSPLPGLAKSLVAAGAAPTAILGFRSAADVFLTAELERAGAKIILLTEDGSAGLRGLVTDAMDGLAYSHVCACGPEAMLKAVCEKSLTSGQFSFEARMGCGFGACMGCSCETKYGAKRICRDGPVLMKEEIIW
ncbi:MAG: dihydroorotate dehydrogenase electron transfer subunit [Oscillospiraceae bacterium]